MLYILSLKSFFLLKTIKTQVLIKNTFKLLE